MTQTHITVSEEETLVFAEKFAASLKPGDILAMRGGLGSGKTVFARGIAVGLGCGDEVTSPTFALVHEYHGTGPSLYHFDMYRVMGFESLCSTGFFDYLDTGGILLAEWSENIEEHLPDNAITVTMERIDDNTRRITIEP
jgi:tRNA threonylcarbamoyladenosine biosynthesis protein TsaE